MEAAWRGKTQAQSSKNRNCFPKRNKSSPELPEQLESIVQPSAATSATASATSAAATSATAAITGTTSKGRVITTGTTIATAIMLR